MPARWLFGAVGIAAAVMAVVLFFAWYAAWLPQPERATRTQLLRWVVLRDLHDESPEVRAALIDRLIDEFRTLDDFGADATSGASALHERHRQRLVRNVALLEQEWFASGCRRFANEPERRGDIVAEAVTVAERWSAFGVALGGIAEKQVDVGEEIRKLVEAMPVEEREDAKRFVTAGVVEWLARQEIEAWPESRRIALASALAAELDRAPLEGSLVVGVTRAPPKRLLDNAQTLLAAWMLARARELTALSDEQQRDHVAACLERCRRWGVVGMLVDRTSSTGSRLAAMRALASIETVFGHWRSAARNDADVAAMERLIELVRSRLVADLLQSMLGG